MSDAEVPFTVNELAAPSAGSKRKRVVLSIHDKQQVLQRLQSGEQPMAIARLFGISRQQVSDIKKNKERILAFCIDAKHMSTLKRKTLKTTSEFRPGVEQELYRWIIRQRRLGRHVTNESMTTKTADLFMQYSDAQVSLKSVANWLRHFKKAHGIKSMSEAEMQQLPEQFVPAMDVTRTGEASFGHPGNLFAGGITAMVQTEVAGDGNPYMQGALGGGSTASLQTTVNTVQQLSEQLARFEREMAVKLDYLDERVGKLCYLMLPTRL